MDDPSSSEITYNVYRSIRAMVDAMTNADARQTFRQIGGMDASCGDLFMPRHGLTVGQFAYMRLDKSRGGGGTVS